MNEGHCEERQQVSPENSLGEQNMIEDAIQRCQEGLAICPDNAELWYALGTNLLALSRFSEAVTALQQAIVLKPDFAAAYNNFGGALLELQRPAEAVQALHQAIALRPDAVGAYSNLGNALVQLQKPAEAITVLQQALAINPDFAAAYNNLGNALQSQGKVADAIAAYNRAIALNPKNLEVYNNRSKAILLSGNLACGFAEYEWRTKVKRRRHLYEWCADKPRWHGESFAGKRLLIFHEQGFGDALHFCRYLPLVKTRGGSVQFSVPKPLLRLFSNFPGIDKLIEHSAAAISETQFDLAVPLLSLPNIFGTTLHTIPVSVPYLTAEQHSIAAWRGKVNCPGTNLRVGLAWAGDPANIPGQIRSCGLQAMSPLAAIPGLTFYSLQKGAAAQQTNAPPPGMQLIDLTAGIEDFADTAALIMNLDLVISIDTAVAHLAGALGKPVWTLLPAAGEWRWLLARNDSPWYPTMRLFRQSAPGDWNSVMTAVARELRTLLSATAK